MSRKILIVGLGSIGKRHLQIVRESLPKSRIVAFRHKRPQVVPDGVDENVYTIDQATRFHPGIAIISNPASFHIKIAMPLAKQGCHLLIEKPLATKLSEAISLKNQIKKRGVVCQVGYNLRYVTSLSKFRNLIQRGECGRPMLVRCEVGSYLPKWRPGQDYRKTVSSKKKLGGGVLMELSHEIDYLRWIFGEVVGVKAWIGKISDLDCRVEDTAELWLLFRDRKSKKAIKASLLMDFVRHDKTRKCTVIGTEGTVVWDLIKGSIESYKPNSGKWITLQKGASGLEESYKNQWDDFLKCIRKKTAPLVSLEDGIQTLKVIQKAKKNNFGP